MAEIINVELEQEVELQTSYELSGGIIPTGTINITTNGQHDVSSYASANVNVQGGVTPTGTKEIEVDAAGTITEDVTNYASVEITVPQGQYKPNIDATPTNPSISVSNGGLITAEVMTQYVNDLLKPSFTEGYIKSSDVSMKVKIGGSATQQLNTVNGQTVTPTTSTQYIAVQGDYVLGAINVAPIPSQYIIPTGTKSITANGTGIDVTQYASVDVNVSGGGGGEGGDLIHNWDLKSSLTDTVGGIVATTTGSIGSDGLTLSTANTYIDFGQIYGTDKTYFMDIVSLGSNNTSGSSSFARLFAVDTDTDTSVGGAVLVYSKSSQRYGWRFYTGSSFDNNQINTRISVNNTRDYFDGKTVAIYIDANRKWHLLSKGSSDGYFIYEGISVVMNNYTDGHVYIGSSANDVMCTAIISGFRVYDGFAFEEATAEEIVAILGGENE